MIAFWVIVIFSWFVLFAFLDEVDKHAEKMGIALIVLILVTVSGVVVQRGINTSSVETSSSSSSSDEDDDEDYWGDESDDTDDETYEDSENTDDSEEDTTSSDYTDTESTDDTEEVDTATEDDESEATVYESSSTYSSSSSTTTHNPGRSGANTGRRNYEYKPVPSTADSETVYVNSRIPGRYHKDPNCRGLQRYGGGKAMTLTQAKQQGYVAFCAYERYGN